MKLYITNGLFIIDKVQPGVAVLIPMSKAYETGLSCYPEMINNVGSIPEPYDYESPDPEAIEKTPRLPTALVSPLLLTNFLINSQAPS